MKISRRKFILLGICSVPVLCTADALLIEPKWLSVKRISLNKGNSGCRIVHFTDLHYKGDQKYLKSVVSKINEQSPDFVCLTGDIVEESKYLDEALDLLSGIKYPLFGVPGNHEYRSRASFEEIAKCFESTGGAWLVNREHTIEDKHITIFGSAEQDNSFIKESKDSKRILLTHYPKLVDSLGDETFDLILAGHSHGGQVRIPFWGALVVPYRVGKYDQGLFRTKAGPLYVNPGIGTFRFREPLTYSFTGPDSFPTGTVHTISVSDQVMISVTMPS